MRSVHLAVAATLALTAPLMAQRSAGAQEAPARDASKSQPVVRPAGDLKWADLDPAGAPGVRIAVLWGDMAKGPFGALFNLPAGFAAPLHMHTHDMRLVIVSGTYVQAPEGKPEFRLGPGSYLLQPGGDYRHTTSCDKAADCVFFVESDGGFDLKPAGMTKMPE